jgi:quinol monooxygenase YgiN
MITVNIYYSGINGNAKRFAEEMLSSGIVDRIRSKKGNLRYEYFYPMEDSETVLLIDSWVNQEALDDHHHSPMMQEIVQLREKYDLHMKVERYLSDEAGIPGLDQSYIRE